MISLAVEYTLHSDSKPEFKQDTLTLEKNMKPSQIERHIQKRWALIREGTVKVTDLVVTRMTEVKPVDWTPNDRYHFTYSA